MNPPLGRNIRENATNKKPIESMVTAKSKPKSTVISYDYEAAISQPDIPIFLEIDNDTHNSCCSNLNNESSTIVLQTKKIIDICSQTCDVVDVKKDISISFSEIGNIENFQKGKSDAVITNRETPSNLHQKDLVHSRNVQKQFEITRNKKDFMNGKITRVHQETENLNKEKNFNKIDNNARLCISQNKTSKIPRLIKPNFILSSKSHGYPNIKLAAKNKLNRPTCMKSPIVCIEEEIKSGNDFKKEALNVVNYQKSKTEDILQTGYENSTNFLYSEKSSGIDADEEFEDLPSPTNKSPIITDAGDDPRSATLLKSMALKLQCKCRSCNDHKYASSIQHTETDSSSSEIKNARKWKPIKHHKFDTSSENLDFSDYHASNNCNGKANEKNNEILSSHITKSHITDSTRMKTYRTTSFPFFDVFFDIVFWPFIFLRAKQ